MKRGRSESRIALVVLAAGASSRMGQPKQLLPWKGTTLLEHCLDQVQRSEADEVLLVLGANHQKILSKIDKGQVKIVINAGWAAGMSGSIRTAMDYLRKASGDFDAVMFCLGDQPLLDAAHYNKLINKFLNNNNKIVASKYSGSHGVPAIFPKSLFSALNELQGDQGAKAIIRAHSDRVIGLDASDLSHDLDTMDQYRLLYKAFGR